MKQRFEAGQTVRVREDAPYPPMARLMRERQTDEYFRVERSEIEKFARAPDTHTGDYEVIQVRYPDGSLSGAIYADIFELVVP